MRRRQLDAMETRIVEIVRHEVSASQAERVRRFLPLITELLTRRKVTLLTAQADDLEAFCQERARTRKAPSMALLVRDVQHLFRALYQSGLRDDFACKTLLPARTRNVACTGRSRLGILEMQLVGRARERGSASQAKVMRAVLSLLTDFLRCRNVSLLTALTRDLQDFCDERARYRQPSSVASLVRSIQTVFQMLLELGLRKDDPSSVLDRPRASKKSAAFPIHQCAIEQVLAKLSSIADEATGLQAFVAARAMAILYLTAAGGWCLEIAALNISDAEKAVNSNGLIHLGRGMSRERAVATPSAYAALSRYLALRRARPCLDSDALFVSVRTPYVRLTPDCVRGDIRRALRWADTLGTGFTPGELRRTLLAAIANEGPGWSVATATAGYRHIPRTNMRYFDVAELSNLLERHHPMGRAIS